MNLINVIEDFITEEERLKIREDVLSFRNEWKQISPELHAAYGIHKEGFCHLGWALYHHENHAQTDYDLKNRMIEKFGWIYDRILSSIEERSGIKTIIDPVLSCPGFHVINLPINYIPGFHTDTSIIEYRPTIDASTIRSANLIIEKPTNGTWLDYYDGDEIKQYHYEYYKLSEWSGHVVHRVGRTQVDGPDQFRITLQCHYAYDTELECNVVYF